MKGAHSDGDKAGVASVRGVTSFATASFAAPCPPLTMREVSHSGICCPVSMTATSLSGWRDLSGCPVDSLISRSNSGASSRRLLCRKGSSPFLLIWCRMIFRSRASLSFCWPFDASGLRQLLQTFASVVFRSELAVGLGLDIDFTLGLRLMAVCVRLTKMLSMWL